MTTSAKQKPAISMINMISNLGNSTVTCLMGLTTAYFLYKMF